MSCAFWPGRGSRSLRPESSRPGGAEGGRGLLSAGCHAAVSREVAEGAVQDGYQRLPGELGPASAVG